MKRTIAAVAASLVVLTVVPAFAADETAKPASSLSVGEAATASIAAAPLRMPDEPFAISRGAALPSLYASLVGLQVFDAVSTMRGLSGGAMEANPVLRGVAGNPAVLWSVKAAATTASIFASERLWREGKRGQAIGVMLATNGIMAAVAVRNQSVLRAQR